MSSLHRRWLLTGGIGSGKSEVRRLLAEQGVRTIDADSVGHVVLQEDALEAVSARWPDVVVDGVVDRSRLAVIVFAQPEELAVFRRINRESTGYALARLRSRPMTVPGAGHPIGT